MYYVYVLKSLSRKDWHYICISAEPERRLDQHNRGKVRSTKGYRPWEIIHKERFLDRSAATRRERYLKTLPGHAELKSLLEDQGMW
ncbi:MAG: GIY-YIG nuclease family protein [Candidatus Neomarinimicrobiota bacterium]